MKAKILPGGVITEGGNSVENKTGLWASRHAEVDQKKCIKCHTCVAYCPEGCIDIEEDGKNVGVNADYCKGCMACAVECPVAAITMKTKQ
jgi:2-oxoacid:acceptor oxidoreductase delta subunit (pyruvate/2-ketoisovalerate family)